VSDPLVDEPPVPDWLQPLVDGLRSSDRPPFLVPPDDDGIDVREAAVLVLFGEGQDGPDVLLLQRSADMRSHAGQPAFPGGRVDVTDAGVVGAALREAQEETGLVPAGVDVLAVLPRLWIPPSASAVTPVVAWWREPSEVRPVDPAESEAVARVPISALADPANRLLVRSPAGYTSPAFRVAGMLVWGFTAAVLSWLLVVAGWEREWDRDVVIPAPIPQRDNPGTLS
jgi:8-oxo-dGTP pyrophosphatase MutT (NUDIX family)